MNSKLKIKYFTILLVPITIVLNLVLKRYPQFVENYYSNTINKLTREALSLITGFFPFSVAELLVALLFIILVYLILKLIGAVLKVYNLGNLRLRLRLFQDFEKSSSCISKGNFRVRRNNKGIVKCLIDIIVYLSALYVLFMLLWGFNYDRLSFDKIAGLNIEKSSKQELYNLCDNLINKANKLRINVKENSQGIMYIPSGYRDVLGRAGRGYEKASALYSVLGGNYGPPKPILLSKEMCYTGITGIYMPYTGEPNVNVNITDLMLPCTASHEMAHQRGFSREDEANYIAYVTCSMHPDADFQYSGTMLALIYSMDALANKDMDLYKELKNKYSDGVKRDLKYEHDFWIKYSGQVEKISNKVNNTYLKSNGQQDGVESYGRMVDLLLAEYRAASKK